MSLNKRTWKNILFFCYVTIDHSLQIVTASFTLQLHYVEPNDGHMESIKWGEISINLP